jgi:hypothetical protein
MENDAEATPRHHSGTAIIALVLGVAAVFARHPINTPIALFAILTAVRARSELHRNPQLRGTVASLVGFILAAGVLVVAIFTFWLPLTIGTITMMGTTWP